MRNFPSYTPLTVASITRLLSAVALAVPVAMAQSTAGGTIIGSTTKDDVGGQGRSITDLERERAKEANKVKVSKPVLLSRRESFNAGIRAAQDAIKAGRYNEATARLNELDTLTDKSVDDVYLVGRIRVAVASASENEPLLIASLESVMQLPQLPAAERIEFGDLLVRKYFNRKDYPSAIAAALRSFADGGRDPAIRRAQVMSYYLNNDFAQAAKEVGADILAAERAGTKPSEEQLRLLLSCAQKLDDKAAHASAMEKYAAHYPKVR